MVSTFQEYTQTGSLQVPILGLSQQYIFEGTVNFDASQWRVLNFGITFDAHQTFNPFLTDIVRANATATYGGQSANVSLTWNSSDYNDGHGGNQLRTMNYGVSGQKIKVTINYVLPSVSLAVQGCTFSCFLLVGLESINANPTNTPSATIGGITVVDNGVDDPGTGFDFLGLKIDPKWVILGAAALVAVLVIRPSAPVTLISSAARSYRSRRKK